MSTDVAEETAATTGGKLGALYLRHAGAGLRLAYFLTGDRGQAEDLLHDAFIRAAGRYQDMRVPDAFDSYLRRAIVNLHTSQLRRRKVERAYLAREAARPIDVVEPPDSGARADLWKALDSLSDRQRAAVVLRFYEDLTEQATAEVMRCSVAAVNSLVARAMDTLRDTIGSEER